MRVAIVDDEPLARDGLRLWLATEPDVEIVGEACDGHEAVRTISETRPDLVFLDVQMPGLGGFQVLDAVASEHLPLVVFVTAYDAHALRAFEVHALDYLLKPIAETRFREALRRARAALVGADEADARDRLAGALDALAPARTDGPARSAPATHAAPPTPATLPIADPAAAPIRRLAVRDGDRYVILRAEEVDWIGSAANYAELHARGATFLLRISLASLEARLDPNAFARIHRSTIVNVDRIKEIVPEWHGDFDVVLRDGTRLRLSRTFRDRLLPPGSSR